MPICSSAKSGLANPQNKEEVIYTSIITRNNISNIKDNEFNLFWNSYPNKKSKWEAVKSFNKAIKNNSFELIMDGLNKYIADHDNKKAKWVFCPEYKHPTTWLNQQCWLDEYDKITIKSIAEEYEQILIEDWRSKRFIDKYSNEIRNLTQKYINAVSNGSKELPNIINDLNLQLTNFISNK
jgi:hypothetical protein